MHSTCSSAARPYSDSSALANAQLAGLWLQTRTRRPMFHDVSRRGYRRGRPVAFAANVNGEPINSCQRYQAQQGQRRPQEGDRPEHVPDRQPGADGKTARAARRDISAEAPQTSVAGLGEAREASHRGDRAGREADRRDQPHPLTDVWPPAGRLVGAAGRGPHLRCISTLTTLLEKDVLLCGSLHVRARRRICGRLRT